jgi:hypothetical protein
MVLCCASGANAALDAPDPQALFNQAEQAERELRFDDALRGYREALEAAPSAPFARVSRARADALAARAEGGFAPLVRLEQVRRDPTRLGDAAAADAFEQEIEAFPPGRVRGEARALLAGALRSRLGIPARAAAVLERIVADPTGDPALRALSLGQAVEIHRGLGDLAAARAAVLRHPEVSPSLTREVLRLWRRVTLRWVAVAALGVVAGIAGAGLLRARRRAGEALRGAAPPRLVGGALYVGGAAAILAKVHGGADPRPFVWLGLGTLVVAAAARALRLATPEMGGRGRALWAACCVMGVLAAAFLALERTDAGYLESFGL